MKVLDVPYYYQIDNPSGEGSRECCGTSNAAMLNFVTGNSLNKEAIRLGIDQPEQIYLDRLRDYGDTTDHGANTRCLSSFGVESQWYTNLTTNDFMKSIDCKIPMVLGLIYKRHGHVPLGIGYQLEARNKPWLAYINDPNGSRDGFSDNWLSNEPLAGKRDIYSQETFQAVWQGFSGNGWGRLVFKVNGIPTGLKA